VGSLDDLIEAVDYRNLEKRGFVRQRRRERSNYLLVVPPLSSLFLSFFASPFRMLWSSLLAVESLSFEQQKESTRMG